MQVCKDHKVVRKCYSKRRPRHGEKRVRVIGNGEYMSAGGGVDFALYLEFPCQTMKAGGTIMDYLNPL